MKINRNDLFFHLRGIGVVLLCTLLFLAGSYYTKDQMIAVSSMQAVRELPVYCVQTDKPQVALSFDAAWGACYLR